MAGPNNLRAWAYQAAYPLLCLQRNNRGGGRGNAFDVRRMAKGMVDYLRGENIMELLVDRVTWRDKMAVEKLDKEEGRKALGQSEQKREENIIIAVERKADGGKKY